MPVTLKCPTCDNLIGPLDVGETEHRFCRWATPADWRALKSWMNGSLLGVTVSGA